MTIKAKMLLDSVETADDPKPAMVNILHHVRVLPPVDT